MSIVIFKLFIRASLCSLAQLAFLTQPLAGGVILLTLALISTHSLLAAILGIAIANGLSLLLLSKTKLGQTTWFYNKADWQQGLAGFNGAIIGIVFGTLITSPMGMMQFLITLLLSLVLEYLLRWLLTPHQLPTLSLAAISTLIMVLLLSRWQPEWPLLLSSEFNSSEPLFSDVQSLLAPVLIVSVMAFYHPIATVQTIIISLILSILAHWITGISLISLVDLWAFNLAPASFALLAVFLPSSRWVLPAAIFNASMAGFIWWLWLITGLEQLSPALLLPFIISTLMTLKLIQTNANNLCLQTAFWQTIKLLIVARQCRQPPTIITGSGINQYKNSLKPIADYPSGSWLANGVPTSTYSLSAFKSCRRSRYLYWQACHRLYQQVLSAKPNQQHDKLAKLLADQKLAGLITETVDGFHQGHSQAIIECYGNIKKLYCLGCGQQQDWPPNNLWQSDLHCQDCLGLLKPRVLALDEAISAETQNGIDQLLNQSSCLIMAGVPNLTPVIADILQQAKVANKTIIFISVIPLGAALSKKDLFLFGEPSTNLLTMCQLIHYLSPLNRRKGNKKAGFQATQEANND